ncbi:MAG: hypothetical protein PVG03_15985 [Desulfarculaceae bacterium]
MANASGNNELYKPKVCFFDFEEEIIGILPSATFNCYFGSLGSPINIGEGQRPAKCLLNYRFPANLHEYSIFVIDLKPKKPLPYCPEDHEISYVDDLYVYYFVVNYPTTIFNPIPYTAKLFEDKISSLKKQVIVILFANSIENYTYIARVIKKNENIDSKPLVHSNYDLLPFKIKKWNKFGTRIIVAESRLSELLNRHKNTCKYRTCFEKIEKWDDYKKQKVSDPKFKPFAYNDQEEVVSFSYFTNNTVFFVFPDIDDKVSFLKDFLTNHLPDFFPKLFPNITTYNWLHEPPYQVPGEKGILGEKKKYELEYKEKIVRLEKDIVENRNRYNFLHDLIKESGDILVKAVKDYLKWLGFDDVRNMDELDPDRKEEDLQVDTENGLLVMEVKGIAGTSKDSDCNQVVKYRRRHEVKLGKVDGIFALYLVNHQRFLPALDRQNPPFTDSQISDAKNDGRGLLTTWRLFQLYHEIESDIVSKEEARLCLEKPGLVEFISHKLVSIGKPNELKKDGRVAILELGDIVVRKDDQVYYHDTWWKRLKILNIQVNDEDVGEARNQEVGLLIEEPINTGTELFIRKK